jgi:hypothetical protein
MRPEGIVRGIDSSKFPTALISGKVCPKLLSRTILAFNERKLRFSRKNAKNIRSPGYGKWKENVAISPLTTIPKKRKASQSMTGDSLKKILDMKCTKV